MATLLDGKAASNALSRALPRDRATRLTCRSPAQLRRTVESRLLDCVVVGPKSARSAELASLRQSFPRTPLVVFGPVRTGDAAAVLEWADRLSASAILVEGIDDSIAGETVLRHGLIARRRAALAQVPARLRLTEPIQVAAWELLLGSLGPPPETAWVARKLGLSREHLSRQFGAGGAPNLKRVIDLLQVVTARDLLANPGCLPPAAARLLGYSSVPHFRAVVRRVAGSALQDFSRLEVADLVRRFVSGRMRSRA